MSELEDLSAKAARLWLEFFQAQAKAATHAAKNLPGVHSLAESSVPVAAEANRWMEGALSRAGEPADVPAEPGTSQKEELPATHRVKSAPAQEPVAMPLIRSKRRRVKTMQRSLSRRRTRRT